MAAVRSSRAERAAARQARGGPRGRPRTPRARYFRLPRFSLPASAAAKLVLPARSGHRRGRSCREGLDGDPRALARAVALRCRVRPAPAIRRGWAALLVPGVRRGRGSRPRLGADAADPRGCLLYTSDAADDLLCVDLGG